MCDFGTELPIANRLFSLAEAVLVFGSARNGGLNLAPDCAAETGSRSGLLSPSTSQPTIARVAAISGTSSSAASRSVTRSAGSSMPTESRIRPSETPARFRVSGSIEEWVIVAGWATRLSTPPSDSARKKYSRLPRKGPRAALQLEAHHGPEACLLPCRNLVTRVVGQSG